MKESAAGPELAARQAIKPRVQHLQRALIARVLHVIPWSAAAIAALAAGAALVCPAGSCRTSSIDLAGLTLARSWQTGWLDAAFAALTWLGSLYVLLPLALLAAWRRGSQHRFHLPLAVAGAAVLAQSAKLLVERPRPDLFPALIAMPADASFPSAHAMQATAFALAWLLRPEARPGAGATFAAAALVLLVCASRIHLQVHFPSDVVFGVAAGACWALALDKPITRKASKP